MKTKHKQQKEKTIIKHIHKIFYKTYPPPTSYTSLICLNKQYRDLDNKTNGFKWVKFRSKFLRKYKFLTCDYCNKKNLIFRKRRKNNQITKDDATLDHKMPISKNGKKFDTKNIVICCKECNDKKEDMNELDFRYLLLKKCSEKIFFNTKIDFKSKISLLPNLIFLVNKFLLCFLINIREKYDK